MSDQLRTDESRCWNEREAFAVSNRALRRLGDDKHLVDWTTMRDAYGCAV